MKKSHKLTDIQKIEIVEKYKTGVYTCEKLSKEYGIKGNSISALLKRRGISINSNRSQLSRKYSLNEYYFDKIDTEEKAYFLGLLYADGNNCVTNNCIYIGLHEIDKLILEKFKIALGSNRDLVFRDRTMEKNKSNQYALKVQSKHMSKQLIKLGCVPNKSLILEFPTIEQVPENLLNHFLRGMWDGDGTIYRDKSCSNNKRCSLTSTRNFCLSAKDIIKSYTGISFGIYSYYKNKISSDLKVGGNKKSKIFLDWLYNNATIYLERKFISYMN